MTVDAREVRLEPNSSKVSTKDASSINFLTKQVDHLETEEVSTVSNHEAMDPVVVGTPTTTEARVFSHEDEDEVQPTLLNNSAPTRINLPTPTQ
jgi:hypothetical protein